MRYNLGELKQVSDELLCNLQIDEGKAMFISSACRNRSGLRIKTDAKRWPLFAAASLVTCAAAVIFIFSAVTNKPSPAFSALSGSSISSVGQAADSSASADVPASALTAPLPGDKGLVGTSSEIMADVFMQTASEAPVSTTEPEYNYALVQGENGLYGLKTPSGKWVIEPKYTTAYVEDGIAYFTAGDNTLKYDITRD